MIAHEHHIGKMNRCLFINYSALSVLSVWLNVSFYYVYILDNNPVVLADNTENLADFTIVFTGNYLDFIVFFDASFTKIVSLAPEVL